VGLSEKEASSPRKGWGRIQLKFSSKGRTIRKALRGENAKGILRRAIIMDRDQRGRRKKNGSRGNSKRPLEELNSLIRFVQSYC